MALALRAMALVLIFSCWSGQARSEVRTLSPEASESLSEYVTTEEYYVSLRPYVLLECGIIASFVDEKTISDRASPMAIAAIKLLKAAHDAIQAKPDQSLATEPPLAEFYETWSADFSSGLVFARTYDRIERSLTIEGEFDPASAGTEFVKRNCIHIPME